MFQFMDMKSLVQLILSYSIVSYAFTNPLQAESMKTSSEAVLHLFPEINSEVVATLAPGSVLEILQTSGDWSLVKFESPGKSFKGWLLSFGVHSSEEKSSKSQPVIEKRQASANDTESYEKGSDAGTSFFFPTAIPRKRGTTLAKGTYFFGWQFEHQLLEQTAIGLHATIPIGVIAIGPQLKQTFEVAEKFHLGIGLAGGFGASLWKARDSNTAYYYAGGLMGTYGDADAGITMGTYLLGGKIGTYDHVALIETNAHYRLSEKFKFMFDFFAPLFFKNKDDKAFDWSCITYGMRINGKSLYGDVGFTIPINDNTGDILRYIPFGIPSMSLGILF